MLCLSLYVRHKCFMESPDGYVFKWPVFLLICGWPNKHNGKSGNELRVMCHFSAPQSVNEFTVMWLFHIPLVNQQPPFADMQTAINH